MYRAISGEDRPALATERLVEKRAHIAPDDAEKVLLLGQRRAVWRLQRPEVEKCPMREVLA
jgi:hypothetical protein